MPDRRPWAFIESERVDYTNMVRQTYGISQRQASTGKTSFLPQLGIKKVIFNNPATIVLWEDDTKTVVKCDGEKFDREKGLAMAISKKAMGNAGRYFEVFKKWIKDDEKSNAVKWCPTCKYLSVDADEIPCNICTPNDNKWKKA